WIRQPAGAGDNRGIVADALGNVFLSFQSNQDAALSKVDASGNLSWTRHFQTSDVTENSGLAADGLGNAYVSGYTFGYSSAANIPGADVYLRKYDNAGTLLWSQQFGAGELGFGSSTSADGEGNVYVSGETFNSLSGGVGS